MPGPLAIREMEARDIGAACILVCQLSGRAISPEDMQNRLDMIHASPIDWLFVCESGGRLLGMMGFRLRENVERVSRFGEISLLVTDAAARHQGIGRALVDFAEQMARDHGCIGTWLVSGLQREQDAHQFYRHLGYAITGYRFVKVLE
jgi:GNAT superfamily N-acetyltransferase